MVPEFLKFDASHTPPFALADKGRFEDLALLMMSINQSRKWTLKRIDYFQVTETMASTEIQTTDLPSLSRWDELPDHDDPPFIRFLTTLMLKLTKQVENGSQTWILTVKEIKKN